MSSFKLPMRKYLSLIYITLSVMSLAQFKDNVFDQQQPNNGQPEQQSSGLTASPQEVKGEADTFTPNDNEQGAYGVPGSGDHEEGPGNPGEPVPIDDFIPVLLLSGFALIVYYQRKNKNINI